MSPTIHARHTKRLRAALLTAGLLAVVAFDTNATKRPSALIVGPVLLDPALAGVPDPSCDINVVVLLVRSYT